MPAYAAYLSGRAGQPALAGASGRMASWHQAQEQVLEKGYVRVRGDKGKLVVRAADVAPGAALALEFLDGVVAVTASREKRRPREGEAAKQRKLL